MPQDFKYKSIKLDSGRMVHIDNLHITETYGGMLKGPPNARINGEIMEKARTMMKPRWGWRQTHMIWPIFFGDESGHLLLPPWLCLAWLICRDPVNPEFMGSELVVIWFAHDVSSMPIVDLVAAAVKGLDWESLAADFDY